MSETIRICKGHLKSEMKYLEMSTSKQEWSIWKHNIVSGMRWEYI